MTEQEAIEELRELKSEMEQYWEQKYPSLEVAICALEEIQQYRAIGTLEEIKQMQKYAALAKKHDTIGKVIEECAEYESIGTPEECREAREKQIEKKTVKIFPCRTVSYFKCPVCNEILVIGKAFCCNCGQRLDWSENEIPDSR